MNHQTSLNPANSDFFKVSFLYQWTKPRLLYSDVSEWRHSWANSWATLPVCSLWGTCLSHLVIRLISRQTHWNMAGLGIHWALSGRLLHSDQHGLGCVSVSCASVSLGTQGIAQLPQECEDIYSVVCINTADRCSSSSLMRKTHWLNCPVPKFPLQWRISHCETLV